MYWTWWPLVKTLVKTFVTLHRQWNQEHMQWMCFPHPSSLPPPPVPNNFKLLGMVTTTPPPFNLLGIQVLGMVTFVTAFALSNHWTSFKLKYKVETVFVQFLKSSLRYLLRPETYHVHYSNWNTSWQLKCIVVNGSVAYGYKYDLP